MPVHDVVLATAQRICARRADGIFRLSEVVAALPNLNEGSVRTHVASRCCVDAPKHHAHRWPYFERAGRGMYRICEEYRPIQEPAQSVEGSEREGRAPVRDLIHAVMVESEGFYVAECLEFPIVSQGATVDEALRNLREAIGLYFEGEDPTPLGIAPSPRLSVSLETTVAAV